uniref:Coiled-coil domain-containing protein 43 n=1 Tax=Glossina palpalis gambiensis TaxID=67801 RepID=A0A1B0BK71_9MUSC
MSTTVTFKAWLNKKLRELNTDETVFGSYILGILEGGENDEEKKEALDGILGEILNDNIDEVIQSIIDKWQEYQPNVNESNNCDKGLDVENKLTKLLEAHNIQTTVKERTYTEEERRIREQILAQYSQTEVSDDDYNAVHSDEESEKHISGGSGNSSVNCIERNTNVQDVLALQKERRELARSEAAAKKQKDKEDRERQKQLREEKKEKRKTVKGERRR